MKITPTAGGGARVRLDRVEADTLSAVIADLLDALHPGGLAATDPVYQRLYPAGYSDDAQAADAFRDLTEDALRSERTARAELCVRELESLGGGRGKADVRLDPESVDRWIRVLNDVRLAVATRIGVTEDDDGHTFRPTDPQAMPRAVYSYLTGLQDALVHCVTR